MRRAACLPAVGSFQGLPTACGVGTSASTSLLRAATSTGSQFNRMNQKPNQGSSKKDPQQEVRQYDQHPAYRGGTPRVHPIDPKCNANEGDVHWSLKKSMWNGFHVYAFLFGAYATTTSLPLFLEGFSVFFVTTGISVLFGHSLGMHRLWIHNSYETSKPIKYTMIHLGTLMGIAGPLGMREAHDLRDWAQRQTPKVEGVVAKGQPVSAAACHPYYSQHSSFWWDACLQRHLEVRLKHPPHYDNTCDDPVIRMMEKTWMLQQLPYYGLLYWMGGPLWVVWGVWGRVLMSTFGHFAIGWFAHRPGKIQLQTLAVENVAIQGYNTFCWPGAGPVNRTRQWLLSVFCAGENFHSNHHAYPGSAKLALEPGEFDLGYWTLKKMQKMGLVWNLKLPADLKQSHTLVKVDRK